MLKSLKILAAAALLGSLGTTAASAAGEAFCNDYAATSVEQYNRAQELGKPVSGLRWHGAFDLHKTWCRIVSKAAARHELNAREAVLDEPAASESAEEPAPSESGEALRSALQDYETIQGIYGRTKVANPTCVHLRHIVEQIRVYSGNQGLVPESFRYTVKHPSSMPAPTIGDLAVDRIHRVKHAKLSCFQS